MHLIKYIVTACSLLLLGTSVVQAQEDFRKMAPKPGPAPKIELGAYHSFKLDNGLQVIVVENHKIPRVAFQVFVDAPPLYEGEKAGAASMAGQLLSTGTTERTKAELDEAVDFIGASLNTSSSGLFASSLTRHTDELLGIVNEVLFQPSFPEDEFEKLKKQTLSGLAAAQDDPSSIASNVGDVVVYGADHPYGNLTTESTVNNITLEDCKELYATYFKPNISYLVIVGDIDLERSKTIANSYFGDWEPGKVAEKAYPFPTTPAKPEVDFVSKAGAVQSVIRITYPVDLKPGSEDAIRARIMNALLGGGSTGKLFQNLREDKGYTYGAYSSLSSDKYVGRFSAGASVRNEVTDSSITQFLYEMNQIRDNTVGDKELQRVKNELTGSFARSLENPQTIASYALNTVRYQLPDDYYATYLKKLNAVSAADVQAMAKKYILPEKAHILVVGSDSVAQKIESFDGDGEITRYSPFGKVIEQSAAPTDLTGEQVIEDYINAIGGRDKLESVQDLAIIMATEFNGMTLQTEMKKKVPNKMATVASMNGNPVFTQIFDGTSGMVNQGGQKIEADEAMLKEMEATAPMFVELDYTKDGYSLELQGIEDVNEAKAYKVLVTDPNGKQVTEFFDTKTSLKVQSIAEAAGQMATTSYSNYQEVDGISFPFTVKTSVPIPLEMKVQSVEFNSGLEDSEFGIK